MRHLLDITPEALTAEMASLGEPAYRARQVLEWVWRKGVADFAGMTNLPAGLRGTLANRCAVLSGVVAARSDSVDGTVKLLLEWPDGERTECVLIPAGGRATACVSTQVGCAMGCAFCAAAAGGFRRHLTAGEIVEQALHLRSSAGRDVTNVVLMGMGEPLANYDATVAAVRAVIDPQRLGISARRVTVSTVGLPGAMRRLAAEGLPVTLAVSLHAPNDALRRRIMPAAAKHPVEKIVSAAEAYFEATRREVTLEHVLLRGVNDTNVCAEGLARIARRCRCNVNLIRYNPVPGIPYERPTKAQTEAFAARLRRRGVKVSIRRSRGLDADAACGQLRRRRASGDDEEGSHSPEGHEKAEAGAEERQVG